MDLKEKLAHIHPRLQDAFMEQGQVKTFPKDVELIRLGQYIKLIPVVLDGLVKVFTSYKDRELLLYYIKPQESCIMSFSASLQNTPSEIFAKTEAETTILLLPTDHVKQWTSQYPDMNQFFFNQYKLRYSELLDTVNHLLFDKMDRRLLNYLKEKVAFTQTNPISISHRQIANELGTAREVISRVMKKLEQESLVQQLPDGIQVM